MFVPSKSPPPDFDVISECSALDDEDIPYAKDFMSFIDAAVTRYHAVDVVKHELEEAGYECLKESDDWSHRLKPGGKYYVTRNNSSLVAFAVGKKFEPKTESAFAIIASHIDSLCLKLRPVSRKSQNSIELLMVAPYSGGGKSTSWDAQYSLWWNRDLAIGGRVMVRGKNGSVIQQLMRSSGPVAIIPSSGKKSDRGPFNYETQMIPIAGLVHTGNDNAPQPSSNSWLGEKHSARLLQCVADALPGEVQPKDILDFDLELYDTQPSTFLGLDSPPTLLSTARMDDKIPEFLSRSGDTAVVYLSDNEELGSNLRQGAKGNFLDSVLGRVTEVFASSGETEMTRSRVLYPPSPVDQTANTSPKNTFGRIMARSFLLSADVANGLNPGFVDEEIYAEGLAPAPNKGMVISKDRDGGMATEPWAFVLATRICERAGQEIQLFENRSDVGGGGTIGPMISQRLGCPAMDVGMPMLSMHSIRGTCGSHEPRIGVDFFEVFLRNWEEMRVDYDFS